MPRKTVAWKFAFLSVLTSDLIWIWYDAVAKLDNALGWSIVIAVVLIASIASAVFVRYFFVYGAKTHLHKMARKAKMGGSKEALEQTTEDERFGKRIVNVVLGIACRVWRNGIHGVD